MSTEISNETRTNQPPGVRVPRALLEAMLTQAGIRGGIKGLPMFLGLYLGAEALPPEAKALVVELGNPSVPILIAIDAGPVQLRFVIE